MRRLYIFLLISIIIITLIIIINYHHYQVPTIYDYIMHAKL